MKLENHMTQQLQILKATVKRFLTPTFFLIWFPIGFFRLCVHKIPGCHKITMFETLLLNILVKLKNCVKHLKKVY